MIEITKKELERIYNENTNDVVCKMLGVSKITLIKYLKEAGISLKGKGGGLVSLSAKKLKLVD